MIARLTRLESIALSKNPDMPRNLAKRAFKGGHREIEPFLHAIRAYYSQGPREATDCLMFLAYDATSIIAMLPLEILKMIAKLVEESCDDVVWLEACNAAAAKCH